MAQQYHCRGSWRPTTPLVETYCLFFTKADKLQAVDDDVDTKSFRRSKAQDPAITISALNAAVKRAEENAERRAKIEFEQWKAVELTKLKVEQSQKSKQTVSGLFP